MPSSIPAGYGQATYSFTHESLARPLAITLGIKMPGTGTDPQDVANELHTRFVNTIMEDIDNGLTCTHVDLFIGNGNNPSGSIRSNTPPAPGERSMVSAPLNTCVLITKQGTRLGRLGRGRCFMPSSAPRDDVSENGQISTSLVTSLNGTWQDFYDQLTNGVTGGWFEGPLPPYIIHRPPHAEDAPTPIRSFVVATKVGTRGSRIR